MFSIQDAAVIGGGKACSLSAGLPLVRSLHAQDYTSSVRSMPVEIVSYIINLASNSSPDPVSESISFSHVCRQWRQISLSTPSLWTCIFLSLPLSKSQLTRTMTGLTRSANCPLDIYMDFRDPSWDWDEASHAFGYKDMDFIMRILVPHASRWRSIDLLTDTWAPIFTFLSYTVTVDSAPFLQSIRLARCNEYFVAHGQSFRPANLAFPVPWFHGGAALSHLRHVSLSGVHVDWTRSGLVGLQELELKYHSRDVMPTLAEFRSILRANATLKRLVILGWGPRTDLTTEHKVEQDDSKPIHLPLEELEIGFIDVTYGIHLLSLFVLPNLRSLAIEDVAFGIQLCVHQDFSPFLLHLMKLSATGQVPLHLLRTLSLRRIHAGELAVQGLFGYLNSLKSLSLNSVDTTLLIGVCLALRTCVSLEELTLKNTDSTGTALALSVHTFLPHLRVFVDVDEAEVDTQDADF